MRLRKFILAPYSRKILTNLNGSLWPFDANLNNYCPEKLEAYRKPHIYELLKVLQMTGSELHIVSQSYSAEKCNKFLDYFYPDIYFTTKQIFKTNEPFKTKHILNAIGNDTIPFTYIDSNEYLLQHAKNKFPLCYTISSKMEFYY